MDVLQAGAKNDAEQRTRFIEVIERQSQRLNGLVEALLTLARAQTGTESVRLDVVDLSTLLASIGDDLETVGGDSSVSTASPVSPRSPIRNSYDRPSSTSSRTPSHTEAAKTS